MKLTFPKIAFWAGIASASWISGYLWTANFSYELSWVRAIYEGKNVAASQLETTPNLFIVGGSGVHMGVDTKIISQTLGMPAINFGLHAALGIEAIISSVEPKIQEGDVVLLIPEYAIASDEDGIGRLAGRFGFLTGIINSMDITWEEKARSILEVGNPSLKSLYGGLLEIYRRTPAREYYTKEVDHLGNPTELKITNPKPGQLRAEPSNHVIQRIKEFKEYVDGQGAFLVLGLPWMLDTSDKQSQEAALRFIEAYERIAPVIYDDDYNLKTDQALFGDAVYHLSYRGVEQRSKSISSQLKAVLSEKN